LSSFGNITRFIIWRFSYRHGDGAINKLYL